MTIKHAFWILVATVLLTADHSQADDVNNRLTSMPFIRVTADVEAPKAYTTKYGLSPELLSDATEIVLRRNKVLLDNDPGDRWWNPRFHILLHVAHATVPMSWLSTICPSKFGVVI